MSMRRAERNTNRERTTGAALRGAGLGLCALALAIAPSATAHEAGTFFMRLGPTQVSPNDSSSAVAVNGTPVAGTGVTLDAGEALGVTFNYMLTDRIGVELLASTPFTHQIGGEGLGIADIGEVTHLPPTVSVQFYPRAPSARLQPYVGVGLNYLLSYDADPSNELEAALGDASIDVDDGFGFAAQLGVDYRLSERWSLNAALWYIDLDVDATIETQTAGFERLDVGIDVNPYAWMIGTSYRF